jgi:hypothetical protein
VQAAEALDPQPAPERLSKALALAQDGVVTLEQDGAALVTSGGTRYRVEADGTCHCPDAQHRGAPCKHRLAVQIAQQATALLAPSTETALPPAVAQPAPSAGPAKRQARPRRSAAWDVHEAPVSSCFKIRVGTLEWTHTMRASDDTELQTRLQAFLPAFRDIAAALQALHAEREAAPAAPDQAAPAPLPQADLQALIQQAVQQALAAHSSLPASARHPRPIRPTATPPASPADWCPLHQVAMEQRSNAKGAWSSHWLASEQRYCKGKA